MGTLVRTVWTDDDGSGTTGSIINNAELQAIYDAVEGDVKSANHAAVTTKSIQDLIFAGDVAFFGGDPQEGVIDTAVPSGATFDKLHVGAILEFDSNDLTGTFKLEGILRSDNAAGVATAILVNLTDGTPDAAVTGSTLTGTGSTTGELIRSGAITFAAGGARKKYGIKVKTNNALYQAFASGLRLVRTA